MRQFKCSRVVRAAQIIKMDANALEVYVQHEENDPVEIFRVEKSAFKNLWVGGILLMAENGTVEGCEVANFHDHYVEMVEPKAVVSENLKKNPFLEKMKPTHQYYTEYVVMDVIGVSDSGHAIVLDAVGEPVTTSILARPDQIVVYSPLHGRLFPMPASYKDNVYKRLPLE